MARMLPLPQLLAELVRRPSVNPMSRTDIPTDILYESRVAAFLEEQLQALRRGLNFSQHPPYGKPLKRWHGVSSVGG